MARNLPALPPAKLAAEWVRRLKRAEQRLPAVELYCGRAFREAEACAAEAEADLYIISAGYGLVRAQDLLSPYSVTVSGFGADSIDRSRLASGSTRNEEWWLRVNSAFGRGHPLSTLVRKSPQTLFLLAVSKAYLDLVSQDLDLLSDRHLNRVRIVGPQLLAQREEARWSTVVLPYDDRLDGPDSPCRGTRADFPQRAARHFLRALRRDRVLGSIEEHRRVVNRALSGWRARVVVERPRHSDEELKKIIDQMWDQTDGQVGRGLRLLRDQKMVACEQSRFKRLFWEVAAHREATHGKR